MLEFTHLLFLSLKNSLDHLCCHCWNSFLKWENYDYLIFPYLDLSWIISNPLLTENVVMIRLYVWMSVCFQSVIDPGHAYCSVLPWPWNTEDTWFRRLRGSSLLYSYNVTLVLASHWGTLNHLLPQPNSIWCIVLSLFWFKNCVISKNKRSKQTTKIFLQHIKTSKE
jgi:hypothetical protein